MRHRWLKIAYANLDSPPLSGPIRHKVGTDELVKLRKEALVQLAPFKIPAVDPSLGAQDPLRQNWGYLGIGEGSEGCFDESGSPIWPSISWRRLISTGSLSNAMLWATS